MRLFSAIFVSRRLNIRIVFININVMFILRVAILFVIFAGRRLSRAIR